LARALQGFLFAAARITTKQLLSALHKLTAPESSKDQSRLPSTASYGLTALY